MAAGLKSVETLAGVAAFTFPLWVPAAIFASFWLLVPVDENARECSRAEYVVQEAGRCLLRPQMWERWQELDKIYGTEGPSCPEFIEQLTQLPVSATLARNAYAWAEDNETNIPMYWRRVLGWEFCVDIIRKNRTLGHGEQRRSRLGSLS